MKDNNVAGAIMAEKGPVGKKAYDLEERTARFGEAIIGFAKTIPRNPVTMPLIGQLVRSGTSVGANYCEADDAESRKDFRHKIGICRKEARETKHWLRMVVAAEPGMTEKARTLWQEAKELHLIFVAVRRNTKD
jgi:four helix bundle protein